MCGINGIADFNRPLELDEVIRMRDVIAHRGPDDFGLWNDSVVALGHRRLSIIDLTPAGHQPMSNEQGTVWITYNGEIYNFMSLRQELAPKYKFRSRSDTEVLVCGYEQWGIDGLLERVNGIFAFAIWDQAKQNLTLARDHMGVKPLYFSEHRGKLLFASEIKALLAAGVPFELNTEAIEEQLVFRYVAGERTLIRGILRLLPGYYAEFNRSGLRVKKYWSPLTAYLENHENKHSLREGTVESLFRESISMQLISDVPVGVLCSGGLDSSIITALVAQHLSHLDTFCVSFGEDAYDDAPFARLVSASYGTEHHELPINPEDYAQQLLDVTWANDEPLAHNHEGQLYAIARLAKSYVTVLLSGEGADELFGGYGRYDLVKYHQILHTMPGKMISRLLNVMPRVWTSRRLTTLAAFANFSAEESILYNSAAVFRQYLDRIMFMWDGRFPYRVKVIEEITRSGISGLAATMIYDQMIFLCSLLDRNDKMTMYASIECRVPFLDYRLVTAANALSMAHRRYRRVGKRLLRERFGHLLPKQLLLRSKLGFGAPFDQWSRSAPILQRLLDQLSHGELVRLGLINPRAVSELVSRQRAGAEDLSAILWTLIAFELWHSAMQRPPAQSRVQPALAQGFC